MRAEQSVRKKKPKKNRDLNKRSLKINGSHLWLGGTKIIKIVRGVPAGSPPVTGFTSFCNAITIYSLLDSAHFVKQFYCFFSSASDLLLILQWQLNIFCRLSHRIMARGFEHVNEFFSFFLVCNDNIRKDA